MDVPNYSLNVPTPSQTIGAGYQLGAGIRSDQEQQQQQVTAQQQAQQQQALLSSLANNPNATATDYSRVMTAIPAMADKLKSAWETRNTAQQQSHASDLLQWGSAIKSGSPNVAADMMKQRADAMEAANGGQPTPESQAMRVQSNLVTAHPQFALGIIHAMLASNPNSEKATAALKSLGDEDRAEAMAPSTLAQSQANAEKAGTESAVAAATAPAVVQAASLKNKDIQSQIDNRSAQLDLDRDKLTSEYQFKNQELQQKNGVLPEAVAARVNTNVIDSISAAQSATKLTTLADRFHSELGRFPSGTYATAAEALKKVTGNQDAYTQLRTAYSQAVTPDAIAAYHAMAPGSFSDTDVRTALIGIPPENADPKVMEDYLRVAAKAQMFKSAIANAQADWQSSVKSLGRAQSDIEVDGVKVPKGTSFKEYSDKIIAPKVQAQIAASVVQGRGYMRYATPDGAPTLAPAATGADIYSRPPATGAAGGIGG